MAQADQALADQRSENKTKNARDRQARKRQRDRDEDIESGRRDRDGKLVKAPKTMVLFAPDSLQPDALNVAEASRPKRILGEHERQQRGTVGRPRTVDYKKAVLTNWMNPLLWTHIARRLFAAVRE